MQKFKEGLEAEETQISSKIVFVLAVVHAMPFAVLT